MKKPLLTFNLIYKEKEMYCPSRFQIEGKSKEYFINSGMLRRNFPQAKTNTRLKIQFYPWEIDVGRTIWLKQEGNYNTDLFYTFSRKGKVIETKFIDKTATFLKKSLSIGKNKSIKFKMVAKAI